MERVGLLVSDLDGTLLGDPIALDEFSEWYSRVRTRLRLAYSSGRFLDSVYRSIDEFQLPIPDAIICGVGTEIHNLAAERRVDTWPQLQGRWDPEQVISICLRSQRLELQPAEFISNLKISFYGPNLDRTYLDTLRRELSAAGLKVTLVYSSGLHLDVLPCGVDKGSAAAFLARHWKINRRSTIVAGDSGNDLAMFREGFPGIVVGNAQAELRSFAGQNVYHAAGHFAAGVIEGLRHWRSDLWRPSATAGRLSRDRDGGRGTRG